MIFLSSYRNSFILQFLCCFGCSILFGTCNTLAQGQAQETTEQNQEPIQEQAQKEEDLQEYNQEPDTLWMVSWHAKWDDALHDFEIIYETPSEEESGDFEATWSHLEDYSQWDYSLGDYAGSINQKWPDRDDEWELRSYDNTTTMKTRWRNDNSEWVINYNNEIKIIWMSKSFNDGNTWKIYKSQYGPFEFYTEYIDDPRDWVVFDECSPELPLDVKIACCFIAMYYTTKPFRP